MWFDFVLININNMELNEFELTASKHLEFRSNKLYSQQITPEYSNDTVSIFEREIPDLENYTHRNLKCFASKEIFYFRNPFTNNNR